MNRRGLLLFLLILPTQLACLWDRDTLASEAKGRLDAIKIIAGWFDRNPPEYYQMRLDRVSRELSAHPGPLALYDDAAVACDRLGRPSEAIAWMEKKKIHLEPREAPQPVHHYRTHANLGTFHAHRWVKAELQNGAEAPDRADPEWAEALITQAIAENPNAHFGREKYQLSLLLVLRLVKSHRKGR